MKYPFAKNESFAYCYEYENPIEELRIYISHKIYQPAFYPEVFIYKSYKWKYKIIKTKVLTALFE
jgi:L-rhamnose isomerase